MTKIVFSIIGLIFFMFIMPALLTKSYTIAYNNDVKNEIEDKVKDAIAVTDIKDEFSYSSYQNEIEEGETYVGVFTGLFLFIAILSVITTMTRVVKKQRIQIGTLKALGFKKNKITNHYQSKNCHIQPWLKR